MLVYGSFIVAEDGKILKRKADGYVVGATYDLGYTYYIDGKLLDKPKLETPSDYEEVFENGGVENDYRISEK